MVEHVGSWGLSGQIIHQKTIDDWTPLFAACYGGHLEVVKFLAEVIEVDPREVNSLQQTPYWIACKMGHLSVVQYLALEARVDTERPSADGVHPLDAALQSGRASVITWIKGALAAAKEAEESMNEQERANLHETMFGVSARKALETEGKLPVKVPGLGRKKKKNLRDAR